MEVTHELGGAGYVFWGGREGYSTLLNTDLKRELDHLGRFLHMAVDYKKQIGFKGQFYIEPKPKEPTKHQYDSDAAACLNFLRDLRALAALQAEPRDQPRHARRPHMMHELEVAIGAGALGSIDANTGDPLLGWDTDQFPTSIYLTDPVHARHSAAWGASRPAVPISTPRCAGRASSRSTCSTPISAAWTPLPEASRSPRAIIADGRLAEFVKERYKLGLRARPSRRSRQGRLRRPGAYILPKGDAAKNASGRQEMLENLINEFI